jgi:TRAP-type mannitol/chloroaromatic compound transport system permease small subunit
MKILRGVIRGIESVSEVSGKSVSIFILALAVIVFFDVIMRYHYAQRHRHGCGYGVDS